MTGRFNDRSDRLGEIAGRVGAAGRRLIELGGDRLSGVLGRIQQVEIMSRPDNVTAALQTLAFSPLEEAGIAELHASVANDPTIRFEPMSVEDAIQTIADSTTTPRGVKLAVLQHWRTTSLADRLAIDDDPIQDLAAAILDPTRLHVRPDARVAPPDTTVLFGALDEYATGRDRLAQIGNRQDAERAALDEYEASRVLFESVSDELALREDWEQPPPACVVWTTPGADGVPAVCFQVHFEVPGATVDDLRPLTNPLNWVACGGGFWKQMKQVDNHDLYQEQAELLPGWSVWVVLRTANTEDASGACLDYELVASPKMSMNEGYLCVRPLDDGSGVSVSMQKCVQWESEVVQDQLVALKDTICLLMADHLYGMANACRIDTATAVGSEAA